MPLSNQFRTWGHRLGMVVAQPRFLYSELAMKQSTRDNLIYLSVSLIIAGLVAADFFYADSRGSEMWLPSRFAFRAVYSTGLLMYFVVRETRKVTATIAQVFECVLFASVIHLAIVFGFHQAVGQLSGIDFLALVGGTCQLVQCSSSQTYGIAEILKAGTVAANTCSSSPNRQYKVVPKPGELIIFAEPYSKWQCAAQEIP